MQPLIWIQHFGRNIDDISFTSSDMPENTVVFHYSNTIKFWREITRWRIERSALHIVARSVWVYSGFKDQESHHTL